jgi:hypothetical protein
VGSGRALFDEDATPCAPNVLPANRKLGALWLGLCIIAESFIEQSGQIMGLLRSDPVKRLQSLAFGNIPTQKQCITGNLPITRFSSTSAAVFAIAR